MSTSNAEELPYIAIAKRKQQEQQSRIPKEWLLDPKFVSNNSVLDIPKTCGILTSRELSITGTYSAISLTTAIANRHFTSEEVAVAFCKRAAVAQQLTNCLTEIMFEDAITRAKWLDAEFSRTGNVVGPFHGLPISLKDSFKVKGYDASIGITGLAFNPATENSALVDVLLYLGAILYVKTNIPQTLMALDSHNHIFNRTLNPRNRQATAGGSSGGEGALLAMRGSLLGVGTDVGGSIRIPAMCNGLVGVKPSAGRVPFAGQESGGRPGMGALGMMASAGPIAHSVEDCKFFLKEVSEARPWERDPMVVFGEWKSQGGIQERPVIGVLRTDGNVRPLPPVAAVLEETVQMLRAKGVEVVELPIGTFQKCNSLANKFFGIDGANFVLDILDRTQEPLSPWLQGRVGRKPQIPMNPLAGIWNERVELQKEMLKIWNIEDGRTVDAIICPVAPHPTPEIDRWNSVSYTSSFVLLDYPAGTIPVRDFLKSDLEREFEPEETELENPWDKVNRTLWDKKTVDRETYLDTTLCIQVVAPKLQERRLVEAMKVIEGMLEKGKRAGGLERGARL